MRLLRLISFTEKKEKCFAKNVVSCEDWDFSFTGRLQIFTNNLFMSFLASLKHFYNLFVIALFICK